MKNHLVFFFKSKIRLKITGKNSDKFIRKLIMNKIELLNIKKARNNTIYVWIYKTDYPVIYKLKTIYEIDVVDAGGWIKIRKSISVNKFLIFSFLLGFISLILLTNLIFNIEVIHNSKDTREFVVSELKKYGIDKYKFKKNFKELSDIKNKILLEYKDKIEWLEIETVGIKYVVRIQLREIPEPKEEYNNRDLVASKDATIKKIVAHNGQVIKDINSYVKKGDTIISGTITLNDNIKGYTAAKGQVYGEVWYNMTVEYPFVYYEEKYTGKKRKSLVFNFLHWNLSIPSGSNYKTTKELILFKSSLLPIKFSLNKQKEVEIIDQVLTEEEVIDHAIALAKEKMEKELDTNEYIISQKNLKINIKDSKIVLETFFVVYEDITDYKEIIIEELEEEKKEE